MLLDAIEELVLQAFAPLYDALVVVGPLVVPSVCAGGSGCCHEEFVAHWLGEHVPLVLKHQSTITRFVTNVVDRRLGAAGEDWDGFGEIRFASAEDAREHFADTPEGARALEADRARFVGHSLVIPVAEYVQK